MVGHVGIGLAISTLAVLAATACSGRHANAVTCAGVRPVTPTRDPAMGDGVALGPIQLDLYPFRAGFPLKVLIAAARPLRSSLTIRGWSCKSGVPLRFFYPGRSTAGLGLRLSGRPYAAALLERAGQAQAYLKPYPGAHDFWPGYFLFPTAGRYKVTLYAARKLLDSAVIATSEHAR